MEVIKMERPVNRYKVSNFSKVDTTKYMNGDIFYTDKEVGVLINSKIKKFSASTPNLKDYVKQSDIEYFITEQDVQTLIDESIPDVSNFITEQDVQTLIDESIPDVSNFITEEDVPDVSNFVTVSEVQTMIDDALKGDE